MRTKKWDYRGGKSIAPRSLHVEIIADYGGVQTTDHAFSEVRNHFFRFDTRDIVRHVSENPVFAFSTIETGFWIAQEALYSNHKNLVIFSNTAPRGDIAWKGENRQAFVCGILDNGIPVFAVNAGFNLSFVKSRLRGLWEVKTPNIGTQFRSRDFYPEATMSILNGDTTRIGRAVSFSEIPDVPPLTVASIDGYGNLKTTIRESDLPSSIKKSPFVRVTINKRSFFALNTLAGTKKGKVGDICMVVGSSGPKEDRYIEIIRLQKKASNAFEVMMLRDDGGKIVLETP